jgi:hypothetical protein
MASSTLDLFRDGAVAYWAIWPHPSGVGFVAVPGLLDESPAGLALEKIPDNADVDDRDVRFASLETATTWARKHRVEAGVQVVESAWLAQNY